jgi:hypothetical protein
LLPLTIPVGLLAKLAERAGWLRRDADLTAQDVVGYLADFLNGVGGEWDWDDFTSMPIADPKLDAIRRKAELVPLPLDEAGRAKLTALLEQARSQ